MSLAPRTLEAVLGHYQHAFANKLHARTLGSTDPLMRVLGVSALEKAAASQYWGRELGMCWEHLVRETFRRQGAAIGPSLRRGADTPCDFTTPTDAVDTKYRLGSGDAGTLGKLAGNARWLQEQGLRPVMLILRDDSLPSALARMRRAGWTVLQADVSFDHVQAQTGFDLRTYLDGLAVLR